MELFHGTDFSVPYLPFRPSVMTVHDLSPWLDRSWQPDGGRIRRRTPLLLRAGMATMVITPSEAVRRAAIERFRLAADRVVAVPLAASRISRRSPVAPGNYFLFVGTLEPRKNIARLIEAWREVRKSIAVDLVLAGRRAPTSARSPPEPGLTIRGAVADEDLPALYSGRWRWFIRRCTKASGCRCSKRCSAERWWSLRAIPRLWRFPRDAAMHVDADDTSRAGGGALGDLRCACEIRIAARRVLSSARDVFLAATAERTREVYAAARRIFAMRWIRWPQ